MYIDVYMYNFPEYAYPYKLSSESDTFSRYYWIYFSSTDLIEKPEMVNLTAKFNMFFDMNNTK